MHIWYLDKWKENIIVNRPNHKDGLRLRFDKNLDPEVIRACKEFAIFLRKEFYFPIRVTIYVKNKKNNCIRWR